MSTASRVVPGASCTSTRSWPTRAFTSDHLPPFGRPRIAPPIRPPSPPPPPPPAGPPSPSAAVRASKRPCASRRSAGPPGPPPTVARRRPTSRLKSGDLPTFGRPTIAMTGSSPRGPIAAPSGVAQRREERPRRRLDDADRDAEVAREVAGRRVVQEDAVHVAQGDRRHQHRAAEVAERREVALDVAAREEPGPTDRAPEEPGRHGPHAHARPGGPP